jgi:Tol biopolymer transport system component
MRCPPIVTALLTAVVSIGGCDSTSGPEPSAVSAYGHIRPFWSPTGGHIGYTDTDPDRLGLWMVDSTGGAARLMQAGSDVSGGSWSPDGAWVTFAKLGQILVKKVDGDSTWTLVTTPTSLRPCWSPDGRTIVFIRNGVRAVDVSSGAESLVSTTGSYVHWFANSGSVLATAVEVEAGLLAYRLRRIDVGSGFAQDLMTFRTSDDCAFFVPSHDGGSVFFGRMPQDGRSQVWSLSLTTFQATPMTTEGGDYPSVSPDGQWIVYTNTDPNEGGLWKMRTDGSEKRRLTTPVR